MVLLCLWPKDVFEVLEDEAKSQRECCHGVQMLDAFQAWRFKDKGFVYQAVGVSCIWLQGRLEAGTHYS